MQRTHSLWRGSAAQRYAIALCFTAIASLLAGSAFVASFTLSADDAQQWRTQSADFDWQQSDASQVRIVGRGTEDNHGNLYFVGTKSYPNSVGGFIDNENMFIARVNADDTLGWTKEVGTSESDGANFVVVMNETSNGVMSQYLYVVGWTWGFMDDGGHALNGFGRFGGRDVVLMKLHLQDGRKLWARQFGTTADDMGYGVQRDGGFDSLLLTGSAMSAQVDAVVELDVDVLNEPRQGPFSLYETQLMDSRARQSGYTSTRYQFGASLKRNGDIVDFAMDGGVTITPRRLRIVENTSLVGEYTVVLNRRPLDNVNVKATIVCLPHPANESVLVQQLAFIKLNATDCLLTFTPSNWNREQVVRVFAIDDAIAEGAHYAVITHTTSSDDPLFNSINTPFLYGRNITMQIDDNDVAGIQLSRRHVFVGEGDLDDSYDVVLRSQPWYPVTVSVVSLRTAQAIAVPSVLRFEPETWNVSQTVVVSAVDDDVSENEHGGLHFGGRLLHYSDSLDRRYRTGRPQCFDVPRCDPQDPSECLSDDTTVETIRVCDMKAPNCFARMGNGACIVRSRDDQLPPTRFGFNRLLRTESNGDEADGTPLTYTAMRSLIADQANDSTRMSVNTNISAMYPFRYPPPRLRGFVLSFLGVLNIGQAQQIHQDFPRTLQTICSGLDRLATHHWTTLNWPDGYFPRVLNATLAMFGGSVTKRHLWQCGMAIFRPGSCGINISIWDNDPGVTLSASALQVAETSIASDSYARYSIVLNAPPSAVQPTFQSSFCVVLNSDNCGLWEDFASLAASVYTPPTQLPVPNVSVAILGNAQVAISPSHVTFTSDNWFVPQWIVVRAVNDEFAEDSLTNTTISHRVQNSLFGYTDERTAFWFQGASPMMNTLFSQWSTFVESGAIPYNYIPSVMHSPQHRQINVQIQDDDTAGVIVTATQPLKQIQTRESDDIDDDWVGDVVESFAFSDLSLTAKASASASASLGLGSAQQNVLVFELDAVTFMKFHMPQRHEGDTRPDFVFARLRVFETPFKVINASSDSDDDSTSPTAFETRYSLRITVVDNAWTATDVGSGLVEPATVKFLPQSHTIEVTALLTKQRFVSIDVTSLMKLLLPTRLPVVSLRIQVVGLSSPSDTSGATANTTTHLCSSLFERTLRPTLSFGYSFPNRLLGATATQSSSVAAASIAVDGSRHGVSATSEEQEPWWEVTLPDVTRLGTLVIFVPSDLSPPSPGGSPIILVVVAALVPFDGQAMDISEAQTVGCPDACPLVQRLPVRKALILSELNVGIQSLRIYREDFGSLQLTQVEAYDPHLMITPVANGAGRHSRLKTDWNGRLWSNSWRLLQSVRQSEDENLARGMRTRQSSTAPAAAVSSLAVDGQVTTSWDPLMHTSDSINAETIAGSTRTAAENDPWWEVDLGAIVPIARIELYPYLGERGRGFCALASSSTSTVAAWAGDLSAYSKTDALLQLEDPFQQTFQITLSDASLSSDGDASSTKAIPFSCAGGVLSVAWTDVFAKARYVTVQRAGVAVVLMLNEVVVTRWNPATTPQFVLLDLRGSGVAPIALSSIQLFAPTEDVADASFALPVAYTIHSVSSQRAASGDGSASSLLTVSTANCYVAARASFREWIVLQLATPTRIGLIDIQSNIDSCGSDVSPVSAMSVSARGLSLEGLRSSSASALLSATPTAECSLTSLATLANPTASSGCSAFLCDDESCRAALSAPDGVAFSDFNDLVALGVPSLAPTTRLPLSQQEARTMVLRDNPVMLWQFDTEPRASISATRSISAYQLATASSAKTLAIDEGLEQSFFSSAVAVQPAMSPFSIELWVLLDSPVRGLATLVTLATSSKAAIADVKWTEQAPSGVFTVRDPSSGASCAAKLPTNSSAFGKVGQWYHVSASYDPSNARIQLSVRFQLASKTQEVAVSMSSASCSLLLMSARDKVIHTGAFSSSLGFAGRIANVAWYVDVLTNRQWLDHFHDFLTRGSRAPVHNSYALSLAARPPTVVTVEVNAESACYHFSLCNVTALPRVVQFTPDNWNIPQNVRVLATDDQLYEGLHHTSVIHKVSSLPTFEMQSFVSTGGLTGVDASKWKEYRGAVNALARAVVYMNESRELISKKQNLLDEMYVNWSTQRVKSTLVARHPYAPSLAVASVDVEIEDATVPGIQFSTSSLIVSEQGRGNDYQILLLSEPTDDVYVMLDTQSDCYRDCLVSPLCPSLAMDPDLACGGGSAGSNLCNITVSPDVLVFTAVNWSFPQTVRVLAVDDRLDEADVHLTTIKATSRSLDPIYNGLFLPDIVVAVEDNDDTAIDYSTLQVEMAEKQPNGTFYELTLLSEPWANVTVAMSNEADGSCYRRCGYPFDEKRCGLPRQQSVSSVHLASKSPREIHEITVRLPRPRVMEVQRLVTFSDHVDQQFTVQVTGGFAPEIQAIEFTFNSAFRTRFKSVTAITTASTYVRSFKIGVTGKSVASLSVDGFATASQVETAINGLILGRSDNGAAVRVTRELLYEQSMLRWQVTFLRFISDKLTFPLLTVTPETLFEGTLSLRRVAPMVAPSGPLVLQYGKSELTSTATFPLLLAEREIEALLRDVDTVYTVLVSRKIVAADSPAAPTYGLLYTVTFTIVESYEILRVSKAALVAASGALSADISVIVTETRPPVQIGGYFVVHYDSPYVNTSVNATVGPQQTNAIAWNASEDILSSELARLHGVGNVSVARQQLSPEGGKAWTIGFTANNGNLSLLTPVSLNLTGRGVTIQAVSVVDGVSLGGSFTVEMGGPLIKTNPTTKRVYDVVVEKRNTTSIPFDASASALAAALASLEVTELANVTRDGVDCDAFDVCEGYVWTVSYINSAGNLPPIQVYGNNNTITGSGAAVTARTVANGTYLSGYFSLELELLDIVTNVTHRAKTWNLPVNVSAAGMDQALESVYFVRSNREAEFDPETRLSRGMLFDKGVRVYREGPYLDGGYTWRLDWAIEDYERFQDLHITIDTTLVTQLIEPLPVPSKLDLTGAPRCNAIPMARFQPDSTDPFNLRGFCVYDLANVTVQERYLCNYTVENPWIVFTPSNWCLPQRVELTPVDDSIDEATIQNGDVTFSIVTHTVFSDDLIYSALSLERVLVAVGSDDVAEVLVSESHLAVSENGAIVAFYEVVLTTEPLYDVKIVALPWLDSADTKCYRFGLCNITLDVDAFVFTPRDWNVPQRVVVKATDDKLDEYDTHETGISHVSYSNDLKYHQLPAIPTIHVTVTDNDDSGFFVSKSSVNVTEGGVEETYEIVLGSEPFAKVTVDVQNVATKGNYATAFPSRLVFTWLNWSEPQTVRVVAVDDDTHDPLDSSSVMVHSIATNDLIYAGLKSLSSIRVSIDDNDVSGIDVSMPSMAVEERTQPYRYAVRLMSEPWFPVLVTPNGANDCYARATTQERVCNASMITTAVYFGAGNWSEWQSVDFLAFDDSLEETPVHAATITHASSSTDPLYVLDDYADNRLVLAITDNDVSFVNISLAVSRTTTRSRLHVAEGGFNDSYSVVLMTEPYEDVVVTVLPRVERIVSIDTTIPPFDAPQVGATLGSKLSSVSSGSLPLVFTPLDWFMPRLVTIFGIDDEVPEGPTQFSAISHQVASADPKYNISNTTLGIVDVAVIISDREAIPPPLPASALFDLTGTHILIAFDSTVYHAATMAIRAAVTGSVYSLKFPSFACSLIFSSALTSLGSGASCAWRSDLKQLIVTLGVGATILPGDALLLFDCTSFASQVCQSMYVIRARHTSRSYTQAAIKVQADSAAMAKPMIIINAPDQVGTCGPWRVDASLSTGSAGRPWKELWWLVLPRSAVAAATVTPDTWVQTSKILFVALDPICTKYDKAKKLVKTDLSSQLSAFITTLEQLRTICYLRSLVVAASTNSALHFHVNSSELQPDTTYVVGLSLTNAFSQQTAVAQSVFVGKVPSPTVFAVSESSLQVSRGESAQPVILQADATLSCLLLAGAQLSFRWFATASDTDEGGSPVVLNLNATNSAMDPRVFRVPRSQLAAGKTYRFRVEASVPLAATSSAFFTIKVVSSPLVPVLQGGNRAVGEKDTLQLTGSSSVDPDVTPQAFGYAWRCEDWTNETKASVATIPCMNVSTTPAAPISLPASAAELGTLTIEPYTLAPQRTLRFFLTVSKSTDGAIKTTRSTTTQTTIWTTPGSVPEVSIVASALKLSPTSRLTLRAVVKSTYPYVARWLEDQGDLGLPGETSNVTTHSAFAMDLTTPSNAIRRNSLTPGQRYTLRLVATDINGNRGFGLVSFVVNAPPSPGRFHVSPKEGDAMVDAFLLECSQWTDDAEDLPLRYSFGVLPTAVFETLAKNLTLVRQRIQPIGGDQLLPLSSATMLPAQGHLASVDMTVVAFITDTMGGVAMASESITVHMPPAATTEPVVFASALLTAQNASDAATKTKYLLSAALVIQRAMHRNDSSSSCHSSGSPADVCSGRGTCNVATRACVCDSGFMGPLCKFTVAEIRVVNDAILSSLASSSVQNVEPSSSGLAQQALVVDTVIQSSTVAFDSSRLDQVTSLSYAIAQNAFALQDPQSFLDSTGATLLNSMSTVLSASSASSATDDGSSMASPPARRARRLAVDDASSPGFSSAASACTIETANAATRFRKLIATLQSLAAIASQDLLPGETPAQLASDQITMTIGAGSRLQTLLHVNLTSVAVICLGAATDSDLFLHTFQLKGSPHPSCSLKAATALSDSFVVAVHSKATLSATLMGSTNGVVTPLALASSSPCVSQAAANNAAAGKAARRLGSADAGGAQWYPLIALSIPHARALSAVEQRKFTTGCRAWNALNGAWDRDVCYKDDMQSTTSATVCFCGDISAAPGLEVLVTLEERLDFNALSKDLYRDDAASIVGSISMAVLLGLFLLGGKFGQIQDRADDKHDKQKTISSLNRSKWSELQQRTDGCRVDDFAVFMAKRDQQEEAPTALSDSSLAPAGGSTALISNAQFVQLAEDGQVSIPNETRVLFGSSARNQIQFTTLTKLLRGCNVILAAIGLISGFVGIDFYLVLGNSTSSDLVLVLYGKPIGLLLMVFAATLVLLGLWGCFLTKGTDASSRIAASFYSTLLLLCVLAQLFFVLLAFRYLDDLEELPAAGARSLRAVWNSLAPHRLDDIQRTYGCCGFSSIADATVAGDCPEEALDASPPRTCVKVVEAHARALFATSFGFLQAVFLAQAAALVVMHTLRSWRRLRLSQLADETASHDAVMFVSVVDVVIHCTTPPALQLLLGLTATIVFAGIDLLAQLHVLSNTVLAGLLGIEIGAAHLALGGVYALVLARGLFAFHRRDARSLQWFTALTIACLLLTVAVFVFVDRFHDHWLLDPAIVDFIHAKYLLLARDALVEVETSLECCGFDSHDEGACVVPSANAPAIATCRNVVLGVLNRELDTLGRRVFTFAAIQAAVMVVAALTSVRMKRFTSTSQVLPLAAARSPPAAVVSFTQTLVHHISCFFVVLIGSAAFAFGLVVIGAGLDAMYQLNVLHLSALLRVFDRHVAVYLLSAGASIAAFGVLGVSVAWSTTHRFHRRLAWAFVGVSAAVFVAAFGFSGFAYRVAHVPLNDEALDERFESFWTATSPQTTRVFLQNALSCCGYDKIERLNGSVVFTDAGEMSAWRLDAVAVEADTYVITAPAASPRRRLSVAVPTPRRLTQVACPASATDPCAPSLKSYVKRVASRAFQLSIALLACVTTAVVAVGALQWRPQTNGGAPWSWTGYVACVMFFVVCTTSVLVALASLFLGLDVVMHWSLFSSSILQLVFPRSIGVAFFLYASCLAFVNVYAAQGATHGVVHRVFLQSVARALLVLSGGLCVGLTGYASRYGGTAWQSHLGEFLDRQWDTLTPLTQHRLSLEFQCCGFNDPVVVKGKGVVFDRPAVGYACSLASARGCRHVMETQIGEWLGRLFVLSLSLMLVETLALACGLLILRDLRLRKHHDWFVIVSRLRFAAGRYKSELRRSHLLLSVLSLFDRKATRAQRLTSVLCGLATSLAVYSAWFAHEGCHRHALKSCRQPDAWGFLGMGLFYGGFVGFAAQVMAHALFESVRNRSDDETSEVAVTRQRKEKALLFRGVFRRRPQPFADLTASTDKVASVATNSSFAVSAVHATTDERWYTWLSRFTHSLFCGVGALLFVFGCGLATFMSLVLLGFGDSLYRVQLDQGPKEVLAFGMLVAATALLAWLAIDVKFRYPNGGRSAFVLVAVAVAAAVLLGGLCVGLFMVSQTLDEDATNWTIRNTNFSVPRRLESVWKSDATGFFRRQVQNELQCCGFRDATDAAFRPCPPGTTVNVEYEAIRVDGRIVMEAKEETRDLGGCYAVMLSSFHSLVEQIAYVCAAVGVALLLLAASALFLAHDVSTAKDAKLKLRMATAGASADVRQTFEKVVGLKIAAPARGKILSKMLSSSLESVAPHVINELSTGPLVSSTPTTEQLAATVKLPNGHVVSSSLTRNRWDQATAAAAAANVPYPAWIVRIVFATCGLWLVAMCYVVVVNSLELGVTTAWRCIAAWAVGVLFHLALVEPFVVFLQVVLSTLRLWWEATAMARLLRYSRGALRIRPSAEGDAARYYASLSLYERIRFNAAVRIQRRLATRLGRRRFLQTMRERREQSHRLLVAHRRLTLKQSIDGFTADEIDAFRLLFQDADPARLGLVSYTVISQSIYQLGVRVDAALVRGFLLELDPAYADLVDFEHFLYGMHRVRVHHQEEQEVADTTKAMTADEREAAALAKEQFVSSSLRFGPSADPQSRVLVKRQNLMRELREERESLSYRLMSKVSKLPPILQRGRSGHVGLPAVEAENLRPGTDGGLELVAAVAAAEDATPTGSYVLLQNRKLSPKKRALEMMLKKKSREEKEKVRATTTTMPTTTLTTPTGDAARRSPRKLVPNLRFPSSPRKQKREDVSFPEATAITTIVEADETEPSSPQKVVVATSVDSHSGARQQGGALPDEEAKPLGTRMLLAKQTASAGKHKVMENMLHKQSERATAAVNVVVALDTRSDGEGDGGDQASTSADTPRPDGAEAQPTTAEKREKITGAAKSSLERAFKKKAASASLPTAKR